MMYLAWSSTHILEKLSFFNFRSVVPSIIMQDYLYLSVFKMFPLKGDFVWGLSILSEINLIHHTYLIPAHKSTTKIVINIQIMILKADMAHYGFEK